MTAATHAQLDTKLLALAATTGLQPRLYTRFPDARVAELVGTDGVHEFPLEIVALDEGSPLVLELKVVPTQ